MLWKAVMVLLFFLIGGTHLNWSVRGIQSGVFWLKGGSILQKREQPVRFWMYAVLMMTVAVFFMFESVVIAVYVLMK